jgi:thioester reductase-like protein
MGCAPKLDWLLDMTPVDFVSDAIFQLSQFLTFDFNTVTSDTLCPIYHLCNPKPIHWSKFVDWMAKFGYPLQKLAYTEWRNKLLSLGSKSSDVGGSADAKVENALIPLIPIFTVNEVDMGTTETMPKFDASLTLSQCSALGVTCSPINDELLATYFQFYISSGFLLPPHSADDQFSIEES